MISKSNISILCVLALALSFSSALVVTAEEKAKTLDTDPHLVGWWNFVETSGKTAADSSKFKRKGTLI